ncbi:MAG TPA: A/G-specific adenine glycosylase [Sphingobium sp.]|uniref:A/G-specific adenine glycosylase n=1 Tax=Sphingobium sp. TaxID=1912891 RepID=UPI002ED5626D
MRVDALSAVHSIPADDVAEVAALLLDHYDRTARRLPWRAPPGANATDPYQVWLSEIMLQQTTVAAVIPYFAKFTSLWPTVHDLAQADDADVMAAWAGLGYYARARNLIACARVVSHQHGGVFPDTEEGLRALPGVGAYTAAAIAAIAFGRRAVVVDANVERVVSRLFAIDTPLPSGRAEIREATESITPLLRSGDFAQAMMDLGSSLCSARNPSCLPCPLRPSCRASAKGNAATYPVKAPKTAKPLRQGSAWWIEYEANVWLVRRPDKGMLGGMRALPGSDWGPGAAPALPFEGSWHWAATPVRHVFTHFALDLHVARIMVSRDPEGLGEEGQWWPIDRLEDAGLPTLFARAAKAARECVRG